MEDSLKCVKGIGQGGGQTRGSENSEKIVVIILVRNDIHLNKTGTVKMEMMVSKALCRQNEQMFIMD